MYNTSKDKNENTNTKKKIPISANVTRDQLGPAIITVKSKMVMNIISIFFLGFLPGIFGFFVGIGISSLFKIPPQFSLIPALGLPVIFISSLLTAAIINTKNSYIEFFNNFIHIHNENRVLVFTKPKIEDTYKKLNAITHFSHKQNNLIKLVFRDGHSTNITHPQIEQEYKQQILNILKQNGSQFSILDSNGLRYCKALPPNFLFEALNPNLKSLQLEFERLYRYRINDNFGRTVAILEMDQYDNINKDYRILDAKTGNLMLRGTYLATRCGNMLKLQSRFYLGLYKI